MINNIQEEYCGFEVCKLLKEKGFDVPTRMCVIDDDARPMPFNAGNGMHVNSKDPYYSCPTQSIALEWIRVNFNMHIHARKVFTKIYDCYINSSEIKSGFHDPNSALNFGMVEFLSNMITLNRTDLASFNNDLDFEEINHTDFDNSLRYEIHKAHCVFFIDNDEKVKTIKKRY